MKVKLKKVVNVTSKHLFLNFFTSSISVTSTLQCLILF